MELPKRPNEIVFNLLHFIDKNDLDSAKQYLELWLSKIEHANPKYAIFWTISFYVKNDKTLKLIKKILDSIGEKRNMKEYGVLYAKTCFPKDHKLNWLMYCNMPNLLPKDLLTEISTLAEHINSEFKDVIIIPMDKSIIPGCVTKPESIEEVANEIYTGMNNIFEKLVGESDVIRLVYGVGEMDSDWIENKVESTHEIGNFPIMIKVGHFLDYGSAGKKSGTSTYETGLYKV
jgi:hypothetical protein